MRPVYKSYFDLAAAMTLVGSSVVVGKLLVTDVPIFMALTARFGIALVLLLTITHRRKRLFMPPRRALIQVFLQAFVGVLLFNILLLIGLRYTTASQSGLLGSTTPALIAVLSWLLLREHIRRYEWIGIALSASGIVVVNALNVDNSLIQNGDILIGNTFVLGAFVCEALFTVFRRTSQQIPPLLGVTLMVAFAFLLCLPFATIEAVRFDFSTLTWTHGLILTYYGIFVSALAYFLWFRGLEGTSTGAASILSTMLPISALVLSAVVLGESFTPGHFLGLALVIAAIVIMTVGGRTPSNKSILEGN